MTQEEFDWHVGEKLYGDGVLRQYWSAVLDNIRRDEPWRLDSVMGGVGDDADERDAGGTSHAVSEVLHGDFDDFTSEIESLFNFVRRANGIEWCEVPYGVEINWHLIAHRTHLDDIRSAVEDYRAGIMKAKGRAEPAARFDVVQEEEDPDSDDPFLDAPNSFER